MKDDRWVSFDGKHKQKVSDLSPELRRKLGIEDLPEVEEENEVTESYEVDRPKIKKKKTGCSSRKIEKETGVVKGMFDELCDWLRKPAK